MNEKKITSIDDYISMFPDETQLLLNKFRSIILKKAPDAIESISYGMPGYKTHGRPLVYFAGYKNHIGLYATPSGNAEFSEELSKFKSGKGSVQFPIDQPIPFDLIERIIEFRVNENELKAKK